MTTFIHGIGSTIIQANAYRLVPRVSIFKCGAAYV